jgi:DNA-binding MarR family transcriptional regulator
MLNVTASTDPSRPAREEGQSSTIVADELVEEIIGDLEPLIVRQYQAAVWHDRSISKTNMFVLMILMENGQMPMNRLAGMLDVSFPSLSGIVDRMEERGLVERIRDDNDRRIVLVKSTAKGHASLAELQEMRRNYLRRVLRAMAVDDRRTCQAAFRAMRRAADALPAEVAGANPCGPGQRRSGGTRPHR